MNRIGLSFYICFIVFISATVVGIATLAQGFAPIEFVQFAEQAETDQVATAPVPAITPPAPVPAPAPATPEPAVTSDEPPPSPETAPEALKDVPKPAPLPPTTEAAYRKLLSEQVAPLAQMSLSDADRKALTAALRGVRRGNMDAVAAQRRLVSNSTGRKLIDWMSLRAGYGTSEQISEFLAANPRWPDRQLLLVRFEENMFFAKGNPEQALEFFEKSPPQTSAGMAALASAHLSQKSIDEAKALVAKAWCGNGIKARHEKEFLARFSKHLSQADHQCRLNRILVANLRWRSSRVKRGAEARRLIPRLNKADRPKATARLSLFLRQKAAPKFLSRVPAKQRKGDWGFAFQYIQDLRRRKKHAAAWKQLRTVPTDPTKISNPDAWWEERHANALNALKAGRKKLAYDLVAEIRPDKVNPAKDQAFFAGWLALRKLEKPKLALAHLKRMRKLVDGPLSSSKAEYWLGRTYAALGQDDAAKSHYEAASGYRDTFHGLLARQTLAKTDTSIELPLPGVPSQEQVKAFLADEAVRAAVLAHKADLPRGYVLKFFRTLARNLEDETQVALLAQLASDLGDGQLEVRTGKSAIARGFNLYIYSYPVTGVPDYKPLRKPPEPAMVLAITRQESEFNTRIVSGAGARGIMQVMPITAKHICRQYRIKCRIKDLLTKPSYNARIATAYIADRTDDFSGSYILTLTGYNAGPGRTRQWLRRIGDPRNAKVEPLDWIYRIPFEETRSYTQKVLSNIQVYRARLGEKNPLRLLQDMNRARGRS